MAAARERIEQTEPGAARCPIECGQEQAVDHGAGDGFQRDAGQVGIAFIREHCAQRFVGVGLGLRRAQPQYPPEALRGRLAGGERGLRAAEHLEKARLDLSQFGGVRPGGTDLLVEFDEGLRVAGVGEGGETVGAFRGGDGHGEREEREEAKHGGR